VFAFHHIVGLNSLSGQSSQFVNLFATQLLPLNVPNLFACDTHALMANFKLETTWRKLSILPLLYLVKMLIPGI
jgi:hypothetical protein